jgi:hypothetical protein
VHQTKHTTITHQAWRSLSTPAIIIDAFTEAVLRTYWSTSAVSMPTHVAATQESDQDKFFALVHPCPDMPDGIGAKVQPVAVGSRLFEDKYSTEKYKTGTKSPFRRRNGCIVYRLDVGNTNFPIGTMDGHLPLLT